jgi:rhodanese-related sulfurtransferase
MLTNSSRNPIRHVFSCLSISMIVVATLSGCTAGSQVPSVALEISPAQAKLDLQKGALLLDVREPNEFTAGHIAGAVLIPLGELGLHLQELPKNRLIIVQCRTGVRSAQGRDLLLQNGFTSVTSLSGGLLAWQAAGLPLEIGASNK